MRTIKNLVGSILISIAIFGVWVVILPSYDERAYLQSVVSSKSADLEVKSNLINKIAELDKEYQSRYAELKRLSLVVPSEKHVEEVITALEGIFSATGIPLIDMAIASGDGPLDSPYGLVSMEFASNTSYDSIINFLYAAEKSLRLIDATSLSISIDKKEGIENKSPTLTVLFKANAYFVSKAPEPGVKKEVTNNQAAEQ